MTITIHKNIIVDSHCHLDMEQFKDEVDQIVERAAENHVKFMQTICTRISNFPNILAIAKRYDNVCCSVGVHPCEVEIDNIVSVKELVQFAQNQEVVGLGETGLDYYHPGFNKEAQKQSFLNHIEASRQTGLPVIIHCRDAEKDCLTYLKEEKAKGDFKALIHCFTGSQTFAKSVLEIGLYISMSGIVTFKNATDLQNIAKIIPLDRLLVETDAPYLAPMPYRGKRNEPGYTKYTCDFIAHLKGLIPEDVSSATTKNFFNLFNKSQYLLQK